MFCTSRSAGRSAGLNLNHLGFAQSNFRLCYKIGVGVLKSKVAPGADAVRRASDVLSELFFRLVVGSLFK